LTIPAIGTDRNTVGAGDFIGRAGCREGKFPGLRMLDQPGEMPLEKFIIENAA